jgi:hypothetical protein
VKRVTWFVVGAAAGASTAIATGKKVRQKADQLKPVNVAKSAASRARARSHEVADAIREGRAAMKAKEAELKQRRDGDAEPVLPGINAPAGSGTTINYIVLDTREVPAVAKVVDDLRPLSDGPRRRSRRTR